MRLPPCCPVDPHFDAVHQMPLPPELVAIGQRMQSVRTGPGIRGRDCRYNQAKLNVLPEPFPLGLVLGPPEELGSMLLVPEAVAKEHKQQVVAPEDEASNGPIDLLRVGQLQAPE